MKFMQVVLVLAEAYYENITKNFEFSYITINGSDVEL